MLWWGKYIKSNKFVGQRAQGAREKKLASRGFKNFNFNQKELSFRTLLGLARGCSRRST